MWRTTWVPLLDNLRDTQTCSFHCLHPVASASCYCLSLFRLMEFFPQSSPFPSPPYPGWPSAFQSYSNINQRQYDEHRVQSATPGSSTYSFQQTAQRIWNDTRNDSTSQPAFVRMAVATKDEQPGLQAALKIDGNLDSMCSDWKPVELLANRRLVQFERSQDGNIVKTSFKSVLPANWSANTCCISCIFPEKRSLALLPLST
jgi:hypothetical protein